MSYSGRFVSSLVYIPFIHFFNVGSQPNIHPGSISSTGRQRIGTATSTQAAQLIGGGIAPTLFTAQVSSQGVELFCLKNVIYFIYRSKMLLLTCFQCGNMNISGQQTQLVINSTHYPVNNSLMIGDYVTPGVNIMASQTFRQ